MLTTVGIFTKRIAEAYAPASAVPIAISSPWSPGDDMVRYTVDSLLANAIKDGVPEPMSRDIALRIPAVSRAHGYQCTGFAETPFYLVDEDGKRADEQPDWLTGKGTLSGIAPYHRKFGMASDWFFNGWACLGFTEGRTDALHIPFGMWGVDTNGNVYVKDPTAIPTRYQYQLVAIPLGYGQNGMLVDGADTLRQARLIEHAYSDRLENPVPLTVLSIPLETWQSWTDDERAKYRVDYVDGRKAANGSVVLKVAEFGIDFPNTEGVDLYETGRNANRLDIANHSSTQASLLEGVRQGGSGGGTELRYSGVANGMAAGEAWQAGLARRMGLAFEARLSLDDIVPEGYSIRGDRSGVLALPESPTNPNSEA